ncbi:MAG: hypothetical protein ACJAXK_001665 [Yoonia sp.]|jgi:hypothetical protein
MTKLVVTRLLTLLKMERAALLCADFQTIDKLAEEKTNLLVALSGSPPPSKSLLNIQSKLEQNQILLASAINGVHAAQTRIAALKEVRAGMRVYGQTGKIEQVQNRATGLSKHS